MTSLGNTDPTGGISTTEALVCAANGADSRVAASSARAARGIRRMRTSLVHATQRLDLGTLAIRRPPEFLAHNSCCVREGCLVRTPKRAGGRAPHHGVGKRLHHFVRGCVPQERVSREIDMRQLNVCAAGRYWRSP